MNGMNPMNAMNPMSGPMNPMGANPVAPPNGPIPNGANANYITEARSMACRFYGSQVGCRFSAMCHYSHDDPNSVMKCKNFVSPQGCYYGDNCLYRHKEWAKGEEVPIGRGGGPTRGRGRGRGGGGGMGRGQPYCPVVPDNFDADLDVKVCKFFTGVEGSCIRGVSCRFRHEYPSAAEKMEEAKEDMDKADENEEEKKEDDGKDGVDAAE